MTEGQYQALQDEIARILSRAHASDALEPILSIVRRELSRLDHENEELRELLNEETDELAIELADQYAEHQAAIDELAARDAVIQQIKALAKRWAAWVPDGTAPHPMYSAGQSATATGCAEELVTILSALPSTEDTK